MKVLLQPADEKASKTFKLVISKSFFVVCLFPANIRNFWQKRLNFLKKENKNGGKQKNYFFFLENKQNGYFCLTDFSKLNTDQIEKKLWRFEDNQVSRGAAENSEKRHDFSLGFDVIKPKIDYFISKLPPSNTTSLFFGGEEGGGVDRKMSVIRKII